MSAILAPPNENTTWQRPAMHAPSDNNGNQQYRLAGRQFEMPLVGEIGFADFASAAPSEWIANAGFGIYILLEGQWHWQAKSCEPVGPMPAGSVRIACPDETFRITDRFGDHFYTPGKFCWLQIAESAGRRLDNSVFSESALSGLEGQLRRKAQQFRTATATLLDLATSVGQTLLSRDKMGSTPDVVCWLRAAVCQMILEATRCPAVAEPQNENVYVTAMKDYLQRRIGEPIRVRDLEKLSGLSRSRLHEVFHAATGLSPMDYLQRLRIDLACRLLVESHDSIGEIAGKVGFGTSQHFATTFRKYLGRTPAEFRLGGRGRKE